MLTDIIQHVLQTVTGEFTACSVPDLVASPSLANIDKRSSVRDTVGYLVYFDLNLT